MNLTSTITIEVIVILLLSFAICKIDETEYPKLFNALSLLIPVMIVVVIPLTAWYFTS